MAVSRRRAGPKAPEPGAPVPWLGIDQPLGCWPTVPRLKGYEAAGFSHVQVRMPARSVLGNPDLVAVHAGALGELIALTGLSLVLHAPDDLLAGTAAEDRILRGTLEYAAIAGAGIVVYHGARLPVGDPATEVRLLDELASLGRVIRRAETLGVRLAIENLAPVFPDAELVSYDPGLVAELVRRLDSPAVGMCLDLGHAHITSGLRDRDLIEVITPLLDVVIVFHAHDNFGAGRHGGRARSGAVEPLRLDLHLAPGAGSVPWRALAPLLAGHPAPVQLEVHPPRPEPSTLAILTRELLGLGVPAPG